MDRNDWTLVGLRLMGVWFVVYGLVSAVTLTLSLLRMQEESLPGRFDWLEAFGWTGATAVIQLVAGVVLALYAPRLMAWFAARDARWLASVRRASGGAPGGAD